MAKKNESPERKRRAIATASHQLVYCKAANAAKACSHRREPVENGYKAA